MACVAERGEQDSEIFLRVSKRLLSNFKRLTIEARHKRWLRQVSQEPGVLFDPLTVRRTRCQTVLDLGIVNDATFVEIDEE